MVINTIEECSGEESNKKWNCHIQRRGQIHFVALFNAAKFHGNNNLESIIIVGVRARLSNGPVPGAFSKEER
jgi:hypothetical protein